MLALAMCGAALAQGLVTTAGLEWPGDPDLFRDIAQAHTFLAGRWDADPFYKGERLWYNPLVPAIVALTSRITSAPVYRLYVLLGPLLNLLAPLTFVALAARLFGWTVAPACLIAFLFLRHPKLPAWEAGTYSPWLMAGLFTQALLYATLLAFLKLKWGPGIRGPIILGCCLGLTFLGHAAPAAVALAAISAGLLFVEVHDRSGEVLLRLGRVFASASAALLVSSPLWLSVACHYRLRVLNAAPGSWIPPLLRPEHSHDLLERSVSAVTLVAVVGFVALLREGWSQRCVLSVSWGIACTLLFVYGQAPGFAARIGFPSKLVPSFHFLFYLKVLEALLFGYGIAALCALAARGLRLRSPLAKNGLVQLIVILLFSVAYPRYAKRFEFTTDRAKAEAVRSHVSRTATKSWIMSHTDQEAVFLSADDVALFVVGAAGRKVVAVDPYFSNPYVDWIQRDRYRRRMFELIERRDEEAFRSLVPKTGVGYVITEGTECSEPASFLQQLFSHGPICIYAVR